MTTPVDSEEDPGELCLGGGREEGLDGVMNAKLKACSNILRSDG
jgi:hypothetical protein